jgi:hypothetical protein
VALALNRLARISALVLLPIVFLDVWYVVAADYDYGALAGTYVLDQNGVRCTLHLRSDRTFVEELNRTGMAQTAEGTWRRYGEAHVSFAKEFLKFAGEEQNASGEAHGQFNKSFGLFIALARPRPGRTNVAKEAFSLTRCFLRWPNQHFADKRLWSLLH